MGAHTSELLRSSLVRLLTGEHISRQYKFFVVEAINVIFIDFQLKMMRSNEGINGIVSFLVFHFSDISFAFYTQSTHRTLTHTSIQCMNHHECNLYNSSLHVVKCDVDQVSIACFYRIRPLLQRMIPFCVCILKYII